MNSELVKMRKKDAMVKFESVRTFAWRIWGY